MRPISELLCRRGFHVSNYEGLLRDVDVVREWNPDLVVLDEAQRIKNWATKTALTVKPLDPPFRLVLTGTPMENRIDELASIVEWVNDLALEPKWRLVPWHTTPVDGKTEIGGARNLDTLRSRLAGCMLRRTRKEVLTEAPGAAGAARPARPRPGAQGRGVQPVAWPNSALTFCRPLPQALMSFKPR